MPPLRVVAIVEPTVDRAGPIVGLAEQFVEADGQYVDADELVADADEQFLDADDSFAVIDGRFIGDAERFVGLVEPIVVVVGRMIAVLDQTSKASDNSQVPRGRFPSHGPVPSPSVPCEDARDRALYPKTPCQSPLSRGRMRRTGRPISSLVERGPFSRRDVFSL